MTDISETDNAVDFRMDLPGVKLEEKRGWQRIESRTAQEITDTANFRSMACFLC